MAATATSSELFASPIRSLELAGSRVHARSFSEAVELRPTMVLSRRVGSSDQFADRPPPATVEFVRESTDKQVPLAPPKYELSTKIPPPYLDWFPIMELSEIVTRAKPI